MTPPTRTLPPRPNLDQLRRQARELRDGFRAGHATAIAEVQAHYHGAEPMTFALHDAQLVMARAHGFDSWPRLKAFVDGATGRGKMIKPVELESDSGRDTWDTIVAASAGDVATLRRLLDRNPRLAQADTGTRRRCILRPARATSKRCTCCLTSARIPRGTASTIAT